jgi:FtsZ-binding cell division protein ZapB
MSDDQNQKPGASAGAFQQANEALQRGAEQMRGTAEASALLSQEMIQRASQNFEVLRRIGETLGSGARTATAELSEYVRHTSQRQQEMARQLSQARTPNDVLDIQTRHFQDNLRELLGLSERLSQHSAEAARQAGQGIGTAGDQTRS